MSLYTDSKIAKQAFNLPSIGVGLMSGIENDHLGKKLMVEPVPVAIIDELSEYGNKPAERLARIIAKGAIDCRRYVEAQEQNSDAYEHFERLIIANTMFVQGMREYFRETYGIQADDETEYYNQQKLDGEGNHPSVVGACYWSELPTNVGKIMVPKAELKQTRSHQ